MKSIIVLALVFILAEGSFAECTPVTPEDCISLREQAHSYMEQGKAQEKQKLFNEAANSYLSAKARYLLSAKKIGNGFFSDAEQDRLLAEEAGNNYARVDDLALEQEQAAEATAALKKKPAAKSKRSIASVSVPSGFTPLVEESPEFEN